MPIVLWPDGAPHAMGTEPEDCPHLIAHPISSERPAGAVIVCPGGGYWTRAPHEADPIAKWLNGLGISAFVLHYRVSPYRHPAPLLDAQRAIRYVRHHAATYNIDPDKIGILGFSAGGHLASSAGTHFDAGQQGATDPIDRECCRPDALVLCYPVISFEAFAHAGSREALLGEHADDALRRSMSSELQVSAETPPTFLWHTAEDTVVPPENSMLFAMALSRHSIPFELHIYEKGPHGVGLCEHDPHVGSWTKTCGEWLKEQGF